MPANTSDRLDQIKKAFKGLFRRRKATLATPQINIVKPPQSPRYRPERPRSYSAITAPEVYQDPTAPSWPIFGPLPTAGGFYCSAVELPGSFGPMLQQRSHSDAGPPISISDLFSELDANSIRRLSVVEDEEDIPESETPIVGSTFQFGLDGESDRQQSEEVQAEDEEETVNLEELSMDKTNETGAVESENSDELKTEKVAYDQGQEEEEITTEDIIDPADIALPESADSDFHSIRSVSAVSSEDTIPRNDSANDNSIKEDDDVSSVYSSDDSEYDSATDDTATVSTPRTSSMRAETMEYFDEKIPVLEETSQVISLVPAPGMTATSGPLNDFPFRQ